MEGTASFGYERLQVWQQAKSLTVIIYKITKDFPIDERYGLTSQLRRSIASVGYNLAEGSTRISKQEQARFVEIAFGSLIEAASQLELANELDYLDDETYTDLKRKCVNLSRRINRYRIAILKN